MRKIILAVALLLISVEIKADNYKQYLVHVGAGLIVIDYLQTREVAKNPDKYKEVGLLISDQPTMREVNQVYAVQLAGHYALDRYFKGDAKLIYNSMMIGSRLIAVIYNRRIGITIEW